MVSVAVFVTKLLSLRGLSKGQSERDAALANRNAPDGSTSADRVTERAVTLLGERTAPTALENELTVLGNLEIGEMGRGLRLLELIGMIAPLLGLLGTVLGMIQSFRSLELAEGAANASILAGGIWQALLTTAAGLIVAIPALVGASMVSSRVELGAREIERVIARAVTIASGEGK